MESLLLTWYDWAVFVGVFLAAAATIYIFFDAQDAMDPSAANAPKAIAAIGLVLTLPSLYVRLVVLNDFVPEDMVALQSEQSNAPLFGYLGLAGTILAIGSLIYYYFQRRPAQEIPEPTQYVAPEPELTEQSTISKPPPVGPTQPLVQEPPATAWLVLRSGGRIGKQHQLNKRSSKIIGRDPGRADIILDDDTVSREHARIKYENGQFVLYDLGSTTGTFVNENRIQRQMLYDDDHISLGRIEMVYKKA